VFTGLIVHTGRIQKNGPRLAVETPLAGELAQGDSIAVNGVCLTAVEIDGDRFEADVMEETLRLTSLGRLAAGDEVNLELALRVGDRLGGHFVQGHVDGTGTIESIEQREHSRVVRVTAPRDLMRYIARKGSIAIDGVSLTVVDVDATGFSVSLIPETLERTTLGSMSEGDPVNLEVDIFARYAVRDE
jgi:riboflavin synthase, alpha subunit